MKKPPPPKTRTIPTASASGQCLCGKVHLEIGIPARWAWHDHSKASRQAQGAAYVTYVGSWKSRFRITKGKASITRFEDKAARTAREPLYHIAIEQQPEWAYTGAPLRPLKGFPGVVWEGPGKRKRAAARSLML